MNAPAPVVHLRDAGLAAVAGAIAEPETATAALSAHIERLLAEIDVVTKRACDSIERVSGERPAPAPYRHISTPRGALNALASQIDDARARLAHLGRVVTMFDKIG